MLRFIRQNAWAEVDGYVQQVLIEHDDQVKKDQLLVEQRSDKLEQEIEALQGELNTDMAMRSALFRELLNPQDLTDAEESQKVSERNQVEQRIASQKLRLEILRKMQAMLKVRSPIDGRVVTWNVSERLLGRPVNRGENLLEIADPTGDWELEIYMPEYRMGHIASAKARSQERLLVTFFLATNPENELEGRVEQVDTSAEVRGEDGNTVLVRVSFDQEALRKVNNDPKIGATATAKIHCGRKPIGYVLFHDLIDFVRTKIWFRFFS